LTDNLFQDRTRRSAFFLLPSAFVCSFLWGINFEAQETYYHDKELFVRPNEKSGLKKLRRDGLAEVAMDLHDLPYYGKSEEVKGLEGRGEAKDGTMRFYRVAVPCEIAHGQSVILGNHFVLPKEETVEVLADLWLGLRQRALRISCLYLGKAALSAKEPGITVYDEHYHSRHPHASRICARTAGRGPHQP